MNKYFSLVRTSFLLLILCLLAFSSKAQILEPSKWTFSVSKNQANVGDVIELITKVKIDEGWYLYSSDFDPNLGPMLTEFKFDPSSNFKLVGKLIAIKPKKKFDDIWGGEYTYFTEHAEFRQKVKVLATGKIIGTYSGQVCTEKDGKCIPVKGKFVFPEIKVASTAKVDAAPSNAKDTVVQNTVPIENIVQKDTSSTSSANVEKSETNAHSTLAKPETEAVEFKKPEMSLWSFFLVAFTSGLLALGTPCVFPIIPMTVSFFTKRSGSRRQGIMKAIFYGLSIIFIYILVGTVISSLNGPGFANFLSTHWAPNLIFFAVFVVFGLSFLGLFEIVLPNSLVNNVDAKADGKGYGAVFFMALTLVLVSFSCTGPIVGSVLVESAGGAIIKPIIGMFGFSLALALPFVTFAIFPQWLSNLPKSGGWLNSVKVVLGFLELALALKYFSTADTVYHWHILDRDIYLALWIVLFSLIGIYLLGKLRLPHDDAIEHVSVGRLVMAIITFSFVVYMIPGLWGAPLKHLSGYLPPLSSQEFVAGASQVQATAANEQGCETPRHKDILHAPHGLNAYFDYKQALACAKAQGKPLFVDFTGHGCVNCRKMEENVWSRPEVLQRLKNDFVVVSLYVDERKELPENEWYTSTFDKEVKKTLGEQNTDLQITRYATNSQPLYVILDGNEKQLASPKAYDPDVDAYIQFLDDAKMAYTTKKPQ